MIIVIDDDLPTMESVVSLLRARGHDARGFSLPREALEVITRQVPDLVISDLVMPELDGLSLLREVQARMGDRAPPFLFLSSMRDEVTMVRALDDGAEDYLVKPVQPLVLSAKVRSILRRNIRDVPAALFRGSLATLPALTLLRFCETRAMTGHLELRLPNETVVEVRFEAGQFTVDDDAHFSEACEAKEGEFIIWSKAASFSDLMTTEATGERETRLPPGRLSVVSARNQSFQVQTEPVQHGGRSVVSLVAVDGKTVWKRSQRVDDGATPEDWEQIVARQHQAVEAEIRSQVDIVAGRSVPAEVETPRERYNRLFDRGIDLFHEKDFPAALAVWEEAEKIDPESGALKANLEVVRERLRLASGPR